MTTSPGPAPPVSIGMPVWNGATFVEAALQSILAQTFADFEIVVSDNASTDETVEIVAALAGEDSRIRLVRQQENIGAARNYNVVFHECRAPLFKWAAHDDECQPTFLRATVDALTADRSSVLAYPRTEFIDANGAPIGFLDERVEVNQTRAHERLRALLGDPERSPLHRCHPVLGLIRRDVLKHTRLIHSHQSADKILLVELAMLGPFTRVDEPLFRRRIHEDNHRVARMSPQQVAAWYDPRAGRRFPMPLATELRGYASAVGLHAAGLDGKWRCGREIARWMSRDRRPRILAGEVRRALVDPIRITRGARGPS